MSLTDSLMAAAWKHAHRLPAPLLRGGLDLAAELAVVRSGKGVRRLRCNLAKVRPDLDPSGLRRLTRSAMRSYLRYFGQALVLSHVPVDRLEHMVRLEGDGPLREALARDESVVMALGHLGNWDLAGAWAGQFFAPVTTVAERLEPPEAYEDFLAFRTGLGMRILTFGDDGVFQALQRDAKAGPRIVPLLADRDLGRSGIEVELFGRRARVAAGPALLALTTGAMLVANGITFERLRGPRRRAAGSPWGIVVHFHPPIDVSRFTGPTRARVQAVTQAWVDDLSRTIAEHPEDWHMLQRVFVEDLDPVRDRVGTSTQDDGAKAGGGTADGATASGARDGGATA